MSTINIEQTRASCPFDSVWVSASAGTGKTKVLIDRVLRLLLQITEPEKILCITFTKAAASEMQNRIHSVLQNWATCSKSDLENTIQNLIQEPPEEEILTKARALFSKTLEAPGGMKIMTIHSFCQSILKRFPLEADVPPHFEVLDDLSANKIKEQILNDVLASPDMAKSLQELAYLISTDSLEDLLGRILNESNKLFDLRQHYPVSLDTLLFNLKQYFNIDKYHSEKQIINEFCSPEEWPELKSVYLTNAQSIRKNKENEEKAFLAYTTNERLKSFKITNATAILLKLAFRVVEKYHILKTQNAYLDYTDLIEKTNNLLSKSTMAAWVLYKLDGGINHILVDEAQDTNQSQWNIIKSLSEEFFAGEDAHEELRTLFVVGDKKQSIFSFQGADPQAFEKMRNFFEKRILDSQNSFYNIPLNYSFRSTEPILRLVNFLLQNTKSKNGVLFENEEAYHLGNRKDDAGMVEIWPIEESKKTDKPDPWKPPVERQDNESAMKRLIDKMANKIQSMIGHDVLPSQNRKVKAGDILILLQKRSSMMNEIVRALRQRNIPVAGVDRLVLSEHLAIQDLVALTEFVLQPKNDLNLANLVKSPLLGLTEDDLYQICVNRGNLSVWDRIQQLYPQTAQLLNDYMAMADKCPPFEFYSTILGALNGRQKFVARFGMEVNEALDEFLNLSLNFEKNMPSSLQIFLDWFSNHDIEIKRDLDNSEIDAVRLMTVHGSKGLQSNIVFLPDTRSTRTKPNSGGDFIWLNDLLPLWIPNSADRPHILNNYFDNQDLLARQEKRRLLYVAITRAKDQLYICGYGKGGTDNWYDLILDALPEQIQPDSDGIIRWCSEQKAVIKAKTNPALPVDFDAIPIWATQIPTEERSITTLSPSKLVSEPEEWAPEESVLTQSQELAMRRGTYLHKLLQFLPSLPADKRLTYAQQNCPADIDLPNNLLTIFDDPALKDIFGPTSLAEVPVVGIINGQNFVGQIDRLVVLPDEIKIIDFKTNRFVPKQVPEIYKKQLNAYKDLLKTIFPDRIIKAYILWTQTLYFEEVQ